MTAKPLYVIKAGSATLDVGAVHREVALLVTRGARVLLVAGGATGIERHYRSAGRPMPQLRLANGDSVRYCRPEEMRHLVDAYEQVTLPSVEQGLAAHGLRVFTAVASRGGLVSGRANRPLKALNADDRPVIVRDHRAGVPSDVDTVQLAALLDAYDVVCVSPPVRDEAGGTPLNVDADVLAAVLSNALDADHLRLVTGSAGLLTDPNDPGSTLLDAYPGDGARYAGGRMRQKVRAAEMALSGSADVAIAGPHTMAEPENWTRFWRTREPGADLGLLTKVVSVPSVSGDEAELAAYLADWCRERGLDAEVDAAGNLVATRGRGPRRLLLLGHLDTVPHRWPAEWRGDELWGRGSVDAKGSLANFLEVLAHAQIPEDGQLRVVGAVEEEVSSSKGAFHARDHYPADAVVIGEPSGSGTLTLGYFGLFKLRVTASVPSGHSAGMDAVSAPDLLVRALDDIRSAVLKEASDALSAIIDVSSETGRARHRAVGVLNFRVPPSAGLEHLRTVALGAGDREGVDVEVLRATPGHAGGRSSTLVKVFSRAFGQADIRPRFVVKKGTSDMNTLATTWRDVPMVAYGPGDSTLDHTDEERIGSMEYRTARSVLADAVNRWFALDEGLAR
ncbi:M20/M25/M40 family metallo-hydrolase [Streptomyces sp. 549]|uniref:M20/M25/M40 family metallo-hydrolase n=1 Tax=Streptomyces sp. 549 TaxID=3049076 RepID=UPI0024C40ED5|nr:M20/M25/M40 family metallo-hydrolase [Streptomyces sp. 549]MDK1476534.1 M20/M25/M40 family metallo-hydrolase [Streptomyces sp. 549]